MGAWRFTISVPNYGKNHIVSLSGATKRLEAKVIDVEKKESYTRLLVRVKNKDDNKYKEGKAYLYSEFFKNILAGESLVFSCSLEEIKNFDEFDYKEYLRKKKIYLSCWPKEVEILEKKGDVYFSLNNFREFIVNSIDKNLPIEHAGISKAILLGDKSGLDEAFANKIRISGISHIFAISGTHIGIIVYILTYVLMKLGISRSRIFYFILIFLIFYLSIIGFPPSALRASIMALFILLAFVSGRLNKTKNSLYIAAFVMLLVSPYLIYDVGFQLSFIAVFGILTFFPLFKQFYLGVNNNFFKYIFNIANLTVAAQILLIPFLIYYFKGISVVSVFTNIILFWSVPFLLGSLFLSLLVMFLSGGVMGFIFFPSKIIIDYLVYVNMHMSSFDNAFLKLEISKFYLFLLYFFIVLTLFYLKRKKLIQF